MSISHADRMQAGLCLACLLATLIVGACVPQEVLASAMGGTTPVASDATGEDALPDALEGAHATSPDAHPSPAERKPNDGEAVDGGEAASEADDGETAAPALPMPAEHIDEPATDAASDSVATTVTDDGLPDDVPCPADAPSMPPPLGATSLDPGHSTVSLRAEWRGHPIAADAWRVGGGQDAGTGDGDWYQRIALALNNVDGVDGHVNYQVALQGGSGYVDPDDGLSWTASAFPAASSDGDFAGTTGKRRAIEDVRIWLTGTIARCYSVRYSLLTAKGKEYTPVMGVSPMSWSIREKGPYGPFAGVTYEAGDGAWPRTAIPGSGDVWDSVTYYGYGDVAVRMLTVTLIPRSYTHTLLVRHENADGSWGAYEELRSDRLAYGTEVPAWSCEQDETYEATTVMAHTAGYEDTVSHVDVHRRGAVNTIRVRYQQADGSWGAWEEASTGRDRVGEVRSWARDADETYEAADAHIEGTAEAQTVEVSVRRRGVTAVFDPNGGTGGGTLHRLVGDRYGDGLPDATREGYRLVGWYTERVGGEPVSADTPVADATYYARWGELEQLRLVAPVAIHYVAQADGSLVGPPDGAVTITNRCTLDAVVSELRVEAIGGFEIVSGDPHPGQIALDITPGGGTHDRLGDYVGGAAPRMPAEWEIDAGGRLGLNKLTGRIGGGDLAADTQIGIIHWYFAARSGT